MIASVGRRWRMDAATIVEPDNESAVSRRRGAGLDGICVLSARFQFSILVSTLVLSDWEYLLEP